MRHHQRRHPRHRSRLSFDDRGPRGVERLSRGEVRSLLATECAVFSAHAIHRMREHVPEIDESIAQAMLASSHPLAVELAAALLQRPLEAVRDTYRMTADHRGILVLVPASSRGRSALLVVTYLRLGALQQSLARCVSGD